MKNQMQKAALPMAIVLALGMASGTVAAQAGQDAEGFHG